MKFFRQNLIEHAKDIFEEDQDYYSNLDLNEDDDSLRSVLAGHEAKKRPLATNMAIFSLQLKE